MSSSKPAIEIRAERRGPVAGVIGESDEVAVDGEAALGAGLAEEARSSFLCLDLVTLPPGTAAVAGEGSAGRLISDAASGAAGLELEASWLVADAVGWRL